MVAKRGFYTNKCSSGDLGNVVETRVNPSFFDEYWSEEFRYRPLIETQILSDRSKDINPIRRFKFQSNPYEKKRIYSIKYKEILSLIY